MIIHEAIIQGSEEWHNNRSTRPTGSEYSKIFTGGGKRSTQREQYMRTLSISSKYELPKFQGNQWTDRGTELEPIARDLFIEKTGLDVREVGFVENDNLITGYSPDGLIYANGVPIASLEFKCFKMDKHLTIINKNEIPTDMKPQVHGALFNTEFKSCVCVFYCPEAFPLDLHVIEVTPDSYTKELEREVLLFCEEYKEKWQEYLAEYEVDKLNTTIAQKMPVLMSMIENSEEGIA